MHILTTPMPARQQAALWALVAAGYDETLGGDERFVAAHEHAVHVGVADDLLALALGHHLPIDGDVFA